MSVRMTAPGVLALALAACSPAPPQAPGGGQAQIPPWGLDLQARDLSVRPGDDFYRYADGHWLDSHAIPPDRARWGSFDELDERALEQVLTVVRALPADAPAGSNAQKVGDYYRAFIDTAAIAARGLAPARPGLEAIAAAKTPQQLAQLMGRPDLGLLAPLQVGITTDQKDPDRYVVTLSQSGLGLPDRDYYLKSDAVYATLRTQYQAHIERLLGLIGEPNPKEEAQAVLEVETRIARLQWPAARRRERDLTYNPRTRAELERQVPGFYWHTLLAAEGVAAQPQFVVREPDAVDALAKLFLDVPADTWRPYFKYHYVVSLAAVLPEPIDRETFDFYGKTLRGQRQQRARDKRAVRALDADLGEAVGALYVERFFPPSSKQQIELLVENLRAAYAARIEGLSWMTPATRKLALEKLAAFHPKLGYPDRWRDYAGLDIVPGDAFGNAARAQLFEWQRQVRRLEQPTDRGEWGMTPQTINAYYNPTFNEVVFPAAILQAPFFDPHADPAVNYGGIGAVIGHEMGHGFDDQGAKSDARGVLRTWWLPADTEAFRQKTGALVAQYDRFTVLPGLNVNGRLTLGENIGDLGGLAVAYDAYHRSLKGRPAAVRDGLTGDERFFLSYAQVWRAIDTDERIRSQVLSDPHSPARFRVNGVVRNLDPWYAAFQVQPTDQLYLAPAARVRIW